MVPRHRCRCREEPVHASQIALLMLCGALLLGAGCASLKDANDTVGGTVAPEPGTPAYYEQKIRGFFALDDGRLVPIRGASIAVQRTISSGMRPMSTPRVEAQRIEGRLLQVMSNKLAIVGRAVTNDSGAVTCLRSCLVATANDWPPSPMGFPVRLLVVPDGRYDYVTESGDKGTLSAYREVVEPSYDAYREIYERDLQGPPEFLITSAVPVETPAPAIATNGLRTLNSESFRQRLTRQRAEQKASAAARNEQQTLDAQAQMAKITKEELEKGKREINLNLIRQGMNPLSPITLTPEEDAEMVKLGVLPESGFPGAGRD
jgi:hypothetical protein